MKAIYLITGLFSMSFFTAIAQEGAQQTVAGNGQAAQGGPMSWLFPIGLMILLMFLMIWPQKKRQKEHQKFLDSLKVGTEVITTGGMIGTVKDISDSTVTLDLGNSQVQFVKSAISQSVDQNSGTNKK